MDYLDILITSRMLFFREFTQNTRIIEIFKIWRLEIREFWKFNNNNNKTEPRKTVTPHSCDTPAPLS